MAKVNNKKAFAILVVSAAVIALSQLIYLWPEQNQPTSPSTLPTSKEAGSQADPEFDKEALYLLINAHRKEAGLSSLRVETSLEMSAQAKITDMLNKNYFRHQDKKDQESWYLFTNAGYHFKKAGENIAFQHNTPWQVFEGWVNSPSHNQQLLESEFEDMGVAVDCRSLEELAGKSCVVVLHLGLR